MIETGLKFLIPILLSLLTLASGVWLSHAGKPLNSAIFNLHKLIALAAVITFTLQIYNALRNTELPLLVILLIIFTVLCVLSLFASGALMSLGKLNYAFMLVIHQVVPLLAALSLGAILSLLSV